MFLFCYVLLMCIIVFSQSAFSSSIKNDNAQNKMDPYQSYAKLLNNIVNVNEQRVDSMGKLVEQQYLDVAKMYQSRPGEDYNNNVYLVVLDDAYDSSGNRSHFRTWPDPNKRGTQYTYKNVRELCRKACIDALVILCRDYECGPGIKRSYPKECKSCCDEHIRD